MKRVALLMLVMAALLCASTKPFAQTERKLELKVTNRGAARVVTLTAEGVPLQEVLIQLAAAANFAIKTDGVALDYLTQETPPVRVREMLLQDLVEHLAGAVDLRGSVHAGAIWLRAQLPANHPEAAEEVRQVALSVLARVLSATRDPREADLDFRNGILHLGGSNLDQALSAFQVFIDRNRAHPLASRARLLAGWCAFELERFDEAKVLLAQIEDHHPEALEVMHGQLLLARCFARTGPPAEAALRFNRVVNGTLDRRLRALAILLRTELYFQLGDGKEALISLSDFDADLEREYPDLAGRVPLANGLCLALQNDYRAAIPHFQLAAFIDPDLAGRTRAAVLLARCYLSSGDLVTATLASEVALKMKPEGQLLIQAWQLRAEVYAALGLVGPSVAALESVLTLATPQDPAIPKATAQIAQILFRGHRFEEAREFFERLVTRSGLAGDAWLMIARCDHALGNHRRALEALDRIQKGTTSASAEELARLRGACWLALGEPTRASWAFQGLMEGSR